MSVENELKIISDNGLEKMIEGLEREMSRLSYEPELHQIREKEEWPHAAWKACSIMLHAIEMEQSRRKDHMPGRGA